MHPIRGLRISAAGLRHSLRHGYLPIRNPLVPIFTGGGYFSSFPICQISTWLAIYISYSFLLSISNKP